MLYPKPLSDDLLRHQRPDDAMVRLQTTDSDLGGNLPSEILEIIFFWIGNDGLTKSICKFNVDSASEFSRAMRQRPLRRPGPWQKHGLKVSAINQHATLCFLGTALRLAGYIIYTWEMLFVCIADKNCHLTWVFYCRKTWTKWGVKEKGLLLLTAEMCSKLA